MIWRSLTVLEKMKRFVHVDALFVNYRHSTYSVGEAVA